VVGDLRHPGVLEVAPPEAEDGQEHARAELVLDEPNEVALARDAHVEVADGGENHPVDAALDEAVGGEAVGELDAGAARGGGARLEAVEGPVFVVIEKGTSSLGSG